jgi:hypothetical protein
MPQCNFTPLSPFTFRSLTNQRFLPSSPKGAKPGFQNNRRIVPYGVDAPNTPGLLSENWYRNADSAPQVWDRLEAPDFRADTVLIEMREKDLRSHQVDFGWRLPTAKLMINNLFWLCLTFSMIIPRLMVWPSSLTVD